MIKKISPYFCLVARLWVGGLFLFSGWIKAVEPYENFRGVLAQYGLLPAALTPVIAQVVPWLELSAGLFLVVGYALPLAALAAAMLSGSFVTLIALSFALGAPVPLHCGCFGSAIQLSPVQILVLDVLNSILTLTLFWQRPSFLTLDRLFVKSTQA